jgi:hypothetical protein
MKKFLTTILALLYLSASMGATIHLHYCMGKLISWGLIDRDSKNCTFCGMAKDDPAMHCQSGMKGCCKDEHRHIKIDKDQKATESGYKFQSPPFDILSTCFGIPRDSYFSAHVVINPNINAPPDLTKVPVFLRNGNFRI